MRDNDLRRHGNRLLEGRHHEYMCLQMELMKVSCIRYPDVREVDTSTKNSKETGCQNPLH